MFGMVPGIGGGHRNFVVFSWLPNSPGVEALIDSIVNLPDDQVGDALARFMIAHVENTFFLPSWWESLSDIQKGEVLRLSALIEPEDELTILGKPSLVDWKIVSMKVRRAGT